MGTCSLLLSAQAEALRPGLSDPVPAAPRYDRGAPAPGSCHHVRLCFPPLPTPQLPGLLVDPPPLHPALRAGEGLLWQGRPQGGDEHHDVGREQAELDSRA